MAAEAVGLYVACPTLQGPPPHTVTRVRVTCGRRFRHDAQSATCTPRVGREREGRIKQPRARASICVAGRLPKAGSSPSVAASAAWKFTPRGIPTSSGDVEFVTAVVERRGYAGVSGGGLEQSEHARWSFL